MGSEGLTNPLSTLPTSAAPLTTPSAQAPTIANSATILKTGLCFDNLSLSSFSLSLSPSLPIGPVAAAFADKTARRGWRSWGRKSGVSREWRWMITYKATSDWRVLLKRSRWTAYIHSNLRVALLCRTFDDCSNDFVQIFCQCQAVDIFDQCVGGADQERGFEFVYECCMLFERRIEAAGRTYR